MYVYMYRERESSLICGQFTSGGQCLTLFKLATLVVTFRKRSLFIAGVGTEEKLKQKQM